MRNVVVLCLDTVRKDFFDQYSRRIRDTSDIEVSQCKATSAWSSPSHASMISGQLAHEHGVHTYNRSFDSLPQNETVFSSLDEHTTLGVSTNVFASSAFNFDKYFDIFRSLGSPNQRFIYGIDPDSYASGGSLSEIEFRSFLKDAFCSDHPASSFANGAVGAIRKLSQSLPIADPFDGGAKITLKTARDLVDDVTGPYFLFVNLMDAHLPLTPHRGLQNHGVDPSWSTHGYDQWEYVNRREDFKDYWENRELLYGATIDYLDRVIMSFIDRIRKQSEYPLSVIVTADHGENLGYESEDRLVNHTSSLSEGLLHVPLSIIGADSISSPKKIVSHLDLPRIIDSLANGTQFEWSKTPRAEVMGMGPNPEPPSHKEFWDRTIRTVYDDDKKHTWDSLGDKSIYSIDIDRPSWQQPIEDSFDHFNEYSDLFETDIETARSIARSDQEAVSISKSTSDRLEQLGYL